MIFFFSVRGFGKIDSPLCCNFLSLLTGKTAKLASQYLMKDKGTILWTFFYVGYKERHQIISMEEVTEYLSFYGI